MKDMKCRAYCWTLNNPTEDEIKKILATKENDAVKYTIFGEEKGEKEETPHLQGYSEFNMPIRLKMFKEIMGNERFHIEPRRGTRKQARDYCMKDGKFSEINEWKEKSQGSRTDLEEVCNKINNGASLRQLRLSDPGMIVKYNKGLKELISLREEDELKKEIIEEFKEMKLYEWQKEVISMLEKKPNKDKILWIFGEGGIGKSTLKKFIYVNMEDVTFLDLVGDPKDCTYALKKEKIILFDIPLKTKMKDLNYSLLEDLKNGLVFSHKYESKPKLIKTPHIVVMANKPPYMKGLSAYKWDIREIKEGKLTEYVPIRKNNIQYPKL